MKKKYVSVLIIAMVAFLIFGGQANAQILDTGYGQIVPYFGVSYNTFNINSEDFTYLLMDKFYDDIEDLDEFGDYYDIDQTVNSGIGLYVGALHWFDAEKYENMALGAEFDWINTVEMSKDDVKLTVSNMGFLVNMAYRFKDAEDNFPGYIDLISGIGVYRASYAMVDRIGDFYVEDSFLAPGGKIALQGAYLFEEQNISLGGRVGFRYGRPNSEGNLTYTDNGLEVGLQISYKF
ncbi:MAG: hypothetical protein ABR596_04225 [Halarsenatibacteraceae bacterium]